MDEANASPPVAISLRDRVFATRSLGLFESLDEEGVTLLAEYSKIAIFRPGAQIIGATERASGVHLIMEGRVRIERSNGRPPILVHPGSPVGLVGSLDGGRVGPLTIAELPTRTLQISRDAFLAALEQNFSLLRSVFRVIAAGLLDVRGPLPLDTPGEAPPIVKEERPRTLVERALELLQAGVFQGANVDAVFDVARTLREMHVPPGHVFWEYGDPALTTLRIVSGSVRCTDAHGATSIVSDGFVVGTIPALAGRPQPYGVRAETAVSAYEILFEDFLVVLEAHPELAMTFLTNFAQILLAAF